MSESLTPLHPPCLAADCDDQEARPGWIARVRYAIQKNEQPVRAGRDLSIEARTVAGLWQPIMLPGGGTQFTDSGERAVVLAKLLA